ncbi:MAG: fused MFS/spermidine synthase [Isosphaeraceae bacterium]
MTATPNRGTPLAKIAGLLFGSGFCALVYQVAWQREFRLVFGASTAASAAVLAIFMGGIGAGSIYLGRMADRHPRPLRLYANLEGLIALFSALTPPLLHLGRFFYIALGGTMRMGAFGGTLARLFIAALVVLPATFLMGGTLPAAGRAAEDAADMNRGHLGFVYGCNTLGAVAGGLFATFVLLEVLGTRGTIWFACLVNALVAVVARAVSRSLEPGPSKEAESEPTGGPSPRRPTIGPAVAAGSTGFAFFLMEIVWYRMLAPLLGGTVYAFGTILIAALLGIGVGGLLYPVIARRFRSASVGGFAVLCTLEALLILAPFAAGDRLAMLVLALKPLNVFGFSGYFLRWAVICVITIVPAAAVAGIQFPWLVAMMGQGDQRVGGHVGLAYASNTAGAVVGALAGGFGLLPWLSAQGCWLVAGSCLAALGLSSALVAMRRIDLRPPALVAAALLVLCLPLGMSRGPTAAWTSSQIGVGREAPVETSNDEQLFFNNFRHVILWAKSGIESTVALNDADGLGFAINGKSDGNAIYDGETAVMSGLVGALLRPTATRAFVIGLGTGSTAGWLAAIPGITRVDVAELEPLVLEVAKACRAVNQDVLSNPKVHTYLGDAREQLLTTRERYDVIFSEPSNPYRAGVASLFTKDFYDSVARILSDDGVFLQWVQGYEIDNQTVRSVYSTLLATFPQVETWQTSGVDLLLVAAKHPHPIDLDDLTRRVETEPFASALRATWKLSGPEGFLSHFVARASFSPRLADESLVSTDDQNQIEFGFARTMSGVPLAFSLEDIRRLAKRTGEDRPEMLGSSPDWSLVDRQRLALAVSGYGVNRGKVSPRESDRERLSIYENYSQGAIVQACNAWNGRHYEPGNPFEEVLTAECLALAGDPSALRFIEQHLGNRAVEATVLRAFVEYHEGKSSEASASLVKAFTGYREDPWPERALMLRALRLATIISESHPEMAAQLLTSLRQPFAAYALDSEREVNVIEIARHLKDQSDCQDVVHRAEPDPFWSLGYLSWRRACYAATNDPLRQAAERDLEKFVSNAPAPLSVR